MAAVLRFVVFLHSLAVPWPAAGLCSLFRVAQTHTIAALLDDIDIFSVSYTLYAFLKDA